MRQVISLNRKWAFTKEFNGIPTEVSKKWNFVNVPHTWNAIDGQDGGNDYYRGTCLYVKEIEKIDLPEAKQYYLEFQGTNSSADLYVNGKKLAHHDGGYSTWRVNITEAMDTKTLIMVAVDNAANEVVYPQMADFTFYGGMYRDVNLICVDDSHFDLDYYGAPGIKVTPSVEGKDAKVEVEVFLTNAKAEQKLVYTLKDKEGNVVGTKTVAATETKVNFEITDVTLWHGRKNPYLYTAEVELVEEETKLDAVSTRFGCRTFKVDPEEGFFLNGESYPLHGVSRHQDRWGFGNALTHEHHEEDANLIYEMGATTIRLAHYQHDQYFYDLCDELGFVVWAEIPYISAHMKTGRENTISQMKELIMQNYNHPSIVIWGLSNEITMRGCDEEDLYDNHVVLNSICKEMDPTRLTVVASIGACDIHNKYLRIPDIVSYNHYFGWYGGDTSMYGPWYDNFHKELPNTPIGISEYGCEALNWHTSKPQQGDYSEEYQAYYHEEVIKQLFTRKYIWATHVWNMFDFGADARNEGGEDGQNHKGLVTIDRKYKKDSFYAYKAWLSDDPFVHLCGKRYVDRVEDVTKITVYSNLPEVELFANGKSLGKKTAEDHFFYFDVPNVGESTLVAVAGECKDESKLRKVEKFNRAYRLVEKGAILNWFDITEIEGNYSINSCIKDILKSKEATKVYTDIACKMFEIGENSQIKSVDMLLQLSNQMGAFTILRLTKLNSVKKPTKEELLEINNRLIQIKKV